MEELARRIARADNRGMTPYAARNHVRARIGNALAVGVTKQILSFLELATTDVKIDARKRRVVYTKRHNNAVAAAAAME